MWDMLLIAGRGCWADARPETAEKLKLREFMEAFPASGDNRA
jgi:hypothetical protein